MTRFLSVVLIFISLSPHIMGAAAETGSFWQKRSQPVEFQDFNSICTDGSLFVATGYSPASNGNSFLSTSEDGKSWTIAGQTANTPLTAVAYGNGRFVAVGWYGAIYASTGGKTWSRVSAPTGQSLYSVAWLGSRFVACGAEGTLLRSVDGMAWEVVPTGTTKYLTNVCAAGNVALALGVGGTIFRSDDGGATWSAVNSGFTDDFTCAAATPSGIVVWAANRRFLWDGASGWRWNYNGDATSPGLLYGVVQKIRFNGTHWLAITSRGEMAASTTGELWYKISGTGTDAAPFGDGWLIVGENGTVSQAVPGVSWSPVNVSSLPALQSIVWSGDRYLAFGSGGSEYESLDGASWQVTSSGGLPWVRRAAAVRGERIVVVGTGGWIAVEGFPAASSANVGAGVDLFGIAASPAAFVAVGKNGRIFRSPDGATWTEMTSGTTELLTSVAWDGAKFHAVGSGGVYLHSTDGVQWQKQTTPGGRYLRAIAATRHGLVAVGYQGAVLTSADGTNWADRSLAASQDFHAVVETDTGILALGKNGAAACSTDGTTWMLPPIPGGGMMDFTSAAFHDGKLVAVSSTGIGFESGAGDYTQGEILQSKFPWSFQYLLDPKPRLNTLTRRADRIIAAGSGGSIWSSTDGDHWDHRTHVTNWNFSDSLTVGDLTVLVGNGVLASGDGSEWAFGKFAPGDSFTSGGSSNYLRSVAQGGGNWVACGYSGKIVVSNDGLNWHTPANSYAAAGYTDLSAVEWGAGRFVVIGADGKLLTSTDIENWSVVNLSVNGSISNLIWTGTEFHVSTDSGHSLLVSADGLLWASRPATPPANPFGKLVTANRRTFSLASSELVESTTDGNSWTRHSSYTGDSTSSAVRTRQALDLLWTGSKYVAVGDEGFIMTSEDSYQWTYRNGGMIEDLNSVNYVRDRFIATGSACGLFSSPDGTTWTKHLTTLKTSPLNGLAWNGATAVAVGNDVVLHSTDLWTWAATDAPSNAGLDSAVWAGDRFIAAGRNYKGGISPDGISWTFQTVPMYTASAIAWSGSRALAGHYTSTDGLAWTRFADSWADGTSVIWDGQKFVVNDGTFIGISEDGLTGYRVTDGPLYIRNVIRTQDGYFGTKSGAAESSICRSGDGIHWVLTEAKLPGDVKGLAWSGRQLMAVGAGGQIYTSSAAGSLSFFTRLTAEGYSPESDLTMQGDLNGDGVPNAVAYYFGKRLDATFNATDRDRLPRLRQTGTGGYELVFKLAAGALPSFLKLAIERSTLLDSWQEVARRLPDGTWDNANVSEQVADGYREVALPVGLAENPSFWRLKVTDVE